MMSVHKPYETAAKVRPLQRTLPVPLAAIEANVDSPPTPAAT